VWLPLFSEVRKVGSVKKERAQERRFKEEEESQELSEKGRK
jgi:hypothetical protein